MRALLLTLSSVFAIGGMAYANPNTSTKATLKRRASSANAENHNGASHGSPRKRTRTLSPQEEAAAAEKLKNEREVRLGILFEALSLADGFGIPVIVHITTPAPEINATLRINDAQTGHLVRVIIFLLDDGTATIQTNINNQPSFTDRLEAGHDAEVIVNYIQRVTQRLANTQKQRIAAMESILLQGHHFYGDFCIQIVATGLRAGAMIEVGAYTPDSPVVRIHLDIDGYAIVGIYNRGALLQSITFKPRPTRATEIREWIQQWSFLYTAAQQLDQLARQTEEEAAAAAFLQSWKAILGVSIIEPKYCRWWSSRF